MARRNANAAIETFRRHADIFATSARQLAPRCAAANIYFYADDITPPFFHINSQPATEKPRCHARDVASYIRAPQEAFNADTHGTAFAISPCATLTPSFLPLHRAPRTRLLAMSGLSPLGSIATARYSRPAAMLACGATK